MKASITFSGNKIRAKGAFADALFKTLSEPPAVPKPVHLEPEFDGFTKCCGMKKIEILSSAECKGDTFTTFPHLVTCQVIWDCNMKDNPLLMNPHQHDGH